MSTLPIDAAGPRDSDQIVVLRNATWGDYQGLMEMRGDRSAPRMSFLDGSVEIMSPSQSREGIKSRIGRLIETWCDENDIEFSPFGAWTQESQEKRSGAEPDECYTFHGREDAPKPDLAIEVIWTSGGLDKRVIYERLGIPELWFWKKDRITVFVLSESGYNEVDASSVLPGIDVAQLARHLAEPVASRAIRAYRDELRRT